MIEINNKLDETSPASPLRDVVREDGESSRRNSGSSQMSSSTSPNYDSGNISDLNLCNRPASLSSAEDDSLSNDYGQQSKFQHLLREKDQSLFLALQDVRKLKSELERLSKSEKWYKSELRAQKNSRMEVLEKLYTNERKFTQENQRLQNECVALYARCSEIEDKLREKKEITKNILAKGSKFEGTSSEGHLGRDFELEQLRQKLSDQEQLIEILRNQKRSLLQDLQKLSCEKDDIILQLQTTVAQLEDENRTITKRCMQLVEAKIELKDELSAKETDCIGLSNEVLDLQITVKSLQEKLHAHITELNQKEQEVDSLRREISQRDQSEEISALVEKKHQQELCEKEESIRTLNGVIDSLKTEISNLEDLHIRYDEQQQVLTELRRDLKERCLEVENLKTNHETPVIQSEVLPLSQYLASPLKEENERLHQQNANLHKELEYLKSKSETSSHSLELNHLRKSKQELDQVQHKYLDVCKMYEKSKFDSDMKDITVERFKFEKEKDKREIDTLRQKLVEVSNKFECQRSLATEFEFALDKVQQEKRRLEVENKSNVDKSLKLKHELNRSAEMSDEKEVEIEKLKAELFEVNRQVEQQKIMMDSNDLSTLLCEKESSEKRVQLIEKLLTLHTTREQQMNAEQVEWENLLSITKSDVALIEADTDDSEFEDLNQLFEEQNLELKQINESYCQQSVNLRHALEEAKEESYAFQRELEVAKSKISDLETQVEALEIANGDYQKEIAHLAGTNERLVEEFNQDFSQERENHNKQTKQLQMEIKVYAAESTELREKVEGLQSEVDELNVAATFDSELQRADSAKERILQNVLETEYRRKMSRYDVHIRSLLSNVKSYKRNLEAAENRYTALLAKSKDMIEPEELAVIENNLKDMRRQFESSQKEINDLRHQLKTVREQFSAGDASKSSSTMDLTNLMDDYKKLIQQSQTVTKRLSTSEIYDLINRSDNCVPKLTNISSSVDGLRVDVRQMCAAVNQAVLASRGSPQPKMSLMDELKLAEHARIC